MTSPRGHLTFYNLAVLGRDKSHAPSTNEVDSSVYNVGYPRSFLPVKSTLSRVGVSETHTGIYSLIHHLTYL